MFICPISTFTGTRPVGAMQGPRPYAPSLRWGIFQSTGDLCRTCTDAGRSVALRRALCVSRLQASTTSPFQEHCMSLAEKRSEEHTSELQSHLNLVCPLLL